MKRKGLLSGIFGPSKDTVWRQVANDIAGEYVVGGLFGKDSIRYQSGDWELVLDTYSTSSGEDYTPYTRMRAFYRTRDSLIFKIYRENIFSPIGKFFGMQDILIGDHMFDDEFIIKSNDERKIKLFLQSPQLKRLIRAQPKIRLMTKYDGGLLGRKYPTGVKQLYFECVGVIKDRRRLTYLFHLFEATLARLVEIESAEHGQPGIRVS